MPPAIFVARLLGPTMVVAGAGVFGTFLIIKGYVQKPQPGSLQ
jgi:hypothetical protein